MLGSRPFTHVNNSPLKIIGWATVREDFTLYKKFKAGDIYPIVGHFGDDPSKLILGTFPTTYYCATRFRVCYHPNAHVPPVKPTVKPVGPKDNPPTAKKEDMVKNPSHYRLFDGVESIEAIARCMSTDQFFGFCYGNCLKYRFRAGKKDALQQDIDKANNYKDIFTKHKHLCFDAQRPAPESSPFEF